MKTIFEHIEYVKGKPQHIRKRIAFGIAGGVSALVALVWFAGTLSSGVFAIQGDAFASSTKAESAVAAGAGNSGDSGVAGAAAALRDARTPAHIEIIDTSSSTSSGEKAAQTVVPF